MFAFTIELKTGILKHAFNLVVETVNSVAPILQSSEYLLARNATWVRQLFAAAAVS